MGTGLVAIRIHSLGMVVVDCWVFLVGAFPIEEGEALVEVVPEDLEVAVQVAPIHSVLAPLDQVQVGGFEVGNFVVGTPVGIGIA